MQTIGAFQAKTHLSQLLDAVEQNGETIAITRHGQVVAWLGPVKQKPASNDPISDAIKTIQRLRQGVTLGKNLTLRELIEEGRR
ncbi:MAG: type II toxin-antitoxin system Phd/YefM family antitoxin [Gammaproteobacteria bacterium]